MDEFPVLCGLEEAVSGVICGSNYCGSRCMLHVPPYKIGVSDRSGKYDIFHRFRLQEMNQLIAEPHNIVF